MEKEHRLCRNTVTFHGRDIIELGGTTAVFANTETSAHLTQLVENVGKLLLGEKEKRRHPQSRKMTDKAVIFKNALLLLLNFITV